MTTSVDVLAVLETQAALLDWLINEEIAGDPLRRVRAAVAELIEADVHLDEMVARRNKFPCPGMDEHVEKARVRRSAALARAKGA